MRSFRVLALILCLPLLAGCGTHDASGGGTAVRPASLPDAGSAELQPRDAVLHEGDVGPGWVAVAAETRDVPVGEAVQNDPWRLARLERGSFQSGYQALYGNADGQHVLSTAATYATAADANTVALGRARAVARQLPNVVRLTNPADAPAAPFWLWRSREIRDGFAVPVYTAQWVRGRLVMSVSVYGAGVTGTSAMRFARLQDGKTGAVAR